ncbi:MAG: non-hydrolyzing UDP-N-acetylglucosamine 2-epimerase [Flavobacteriaceae bacterium]
MKLVTIIGARPQFIKAGTLSRYIQKTPGIEEVLVHTGQHYDNKMSDIFFKELKIPKPKYNLNVGGLTHGAMTGKMIEKIEPILFQEKPDWIILYGDTNSTLAGAIAASKLNIKIAHIEAGLRSFNLQMPEEINRILADRVSNLLFCPTQVAVDNLKKEGFNNYDAQVVLVGDIMYEGSLFYSKLKKRPPSVSTNSFVLATLHRAENTNNKDKLQKILRGLDVLGQSKDVVIPLHPRTKTKMEEFHLGYHNIDFIEPVSYLEMNWLLEKSEFVLTDSGGLQKEAYFFKKPCITLRNETEWKELVDNSVNLLVGDDDQKIIDASDLSWLDDSGFEKLLYGNGETSKKIIKYLTNF